MNRPTLLGLIGLSLALGACAPAGTTPAADPVNVTVLGLNDFHGNLEPTGFAGIKVPSPSDPTKTVNLLTGGVEIIGGYVNQTRAQNPNTLFVGAGDLIGASPVTSSLLRDEPSVIALSKLGMKTSSLGNHEFDQGLKELLRMQNGGCDSNDMSKACKFDPNYPGASFKWLGANVVDKVTGKPVFQPYDVEQIGGVRVAFVGAVLKDTPTIVSPQGVATLNFLDEATSINAYIPELKAQKVDAVIVLIHQGGQAKDGYSVPACGTLSGPIVDIVKKLDPLVSAVISGHTHQGYNCLVDGRTVIQGDFYGHLLQRLDLKVDRANHKVLEIKAANVVMDTRSLPKDADMTALLNKAKGLTDAIKLTPVATISRAYTKAPNPAGESALGDLIADSQLSATATAERGGAVVAFMNPGGIRADLNPAGGTTTVTFGDVYAVQPFGNTLTVVSLTGAQIRTLLEQQWAGQANGPRILQVSKGFAYSYDLSKPDGSKVDPASIKLNGTTLDAAASYRVVVNSFLAGGGDSFLVLKDGTNRLEQPNLIDVDAFSAYLKANPGAPDAPQNRITKLGQ